MLEAAQHKNGDRRNGDDASAGKNQPDNEAPGTTLRRYCIQIQSQSSSAHPPRFETAHQRTAKEHAPE
eukprot:3012691-Alexandrium_andersonii.AAC.1